MFIVTAKLNKRKVFFIAAAVILILAVVLAVLMGSKRKDAEAVSLIQVVRDNDERVSYLESLGWQVEEAPMEAESILIPRQMGEAYTAYNKLQQEQGFDLNHYGGLQATRYTYKVLNYPGMKADDIIVADLVVYRNEVIAGDVQSTEMDGFMHGLTYPG